MNKEIAFVMSEELQNKIEYGVLFFKLSKSDFVELAIKEYANKKGVSLPEEVRLTQKVRGVLTVKKNRDNTITVGERIDAEEE